MRTILTLATLALLYSACAPAPDTAPATVPGHAAGDALAGDLGGAADDAAAVREVVTRFGERLDQVALLAPADQVRAQLRNAYAPFVSEELLASWLADPTRAPGRTTSSPAPDRIEITSLRRVIAGVYAVTGRIVLMTSVERASEAEDDAGTKPVRMLVEKRAGDWRITSFRPPIARDQATGPVPFGTTVTVSGERVCLPKRGDGPMTLECSLGLRDSEGNHYRLLFSAAESERALPPPATEGRLSVRGILRPPDPDTTYDIVGVIEVDSVEVASDEATSGAASGGVAGPEDAASGDATPSTAIPDSWPTFETPSLTLRHPPSFAVAAASDKKDVRADSYVPACREGFLACAYLADDSLEDSNFGSAGVGVFVSDTADAANCETSEGNFAVVQDPHRETLNGREYLVFTTGEAGMSHRARDVVHRRWQDGTCLEIVARVAWTVFEVYEPGTVREFSDAQRAALRQDLRSIVASVDYRP